MRRCLLNGKMNSQTKLRIQSVTNASQQMDVTKRKRKIPHKIVDTESIDVVTSFWGPIETIPIDSFVKDILLERFKIEIINKYKYTVSKKMCNNRKPNTPRKKKKRQSVKDTSNTTEDDLNQRSYPSPQQSIIHQRIIIGINQVTRLLEKSAPCVPLLIFMTQDIRPPTLVMHIPCLCKQLGIPILLIPGNRSSLELGKIMGVKSVSILALMPRLTSNAYRKDPQIDSHDSIDSQRILLEDTCHSDIDSFIQFAASKVPPQQSKV